MKRQLQNRYTAPSEDVDLYAPQEVDLEGVAPRYTTGWQ